MKTYTIRYLYTVEVTVQAEDEATAFENAGSVCIEAVQDRHGEFPPGVQGVSVDYIELENYYEEKI